jgi:hypothetical protein
MSLFKSIYTSKLLIPGDTPAANDFLSSIDTAGTLAWVASTAATSVSAVDGTAALPSVSFISDASTGIYKSGTTQLGVATNGVQLANFATPTDLTDSVVSINSSLDSSAVGNGSFVLSGGVSVAKSLNVGGNVAVLGNLSVTGTTSTTNSESLLVTDSKIILNNGYTTSVGKESSIVSNYLPIGTTITSAGVGFSTTSVTVGAHASYTAGDIMQISNAVNSANNGLFIVASDSGTEIVINTSPTVGFVKSAFILDSTDNVALVIKTTITEIRSSSNGVWQTKSGSTQAEFTTYDTVLVGTSVELNDIDTTGANVLNVGSANSTGVSLGASDSNTTVLGNLLVKDEVDTTSASVLTLGSTNASSVLIGSTGVVSTVVGNLEIKDSIDTTVATSMIVGSTNATDVSIGSATADTNVLGALSVTGISDFTNEKHGINVYAGVGPHIIETNGKRINTVNHSDASSVLMPDSAVGTAHQGELYTIINLTANSVSITTAAADKIDDNSSDTVTLTDIYQRVTLQLVNSIWFIV